MVTSPLSRLAVLFTLSAIAFALQPLAAQPESETKSSKPSNDATKAATVTPAELAGFVKGPWTLPTRGFSLSLPEGWKATTSGRMHRALTCALVGPTGDFRQIILVQMGVTRFPTLQAHAENLNENEQGAALGKPRALGQEVAYVLQLPGNEPGMNKIWNQQRAILVKHGKQTFTIRIFADKGEGIDSTVEEFFKRWKWLPFSSPATQLQLASRPSSFERGRFKINLPATMWLVSAEAKQAMLAAYDARTDISAFTVSVAFISGPKPMSLATMRQSFGATIKQQAELKKDLVWRDEAGNPPRSMSSFFEIPWAEPGYSGYSGYGLVKMPGNDWGLLSFTITGQDPKTRALYQAAAAKILASAKISLAK